MWQMPAITEAEFTRFRDLILEETGIHLTDRKRQLLVSRLIPRLRLLGLHTFSDYYDQLTQKSSEQERRIFINRITTNKTSFFREPHHFDFLKNRLIPHWRTHAQRPLRIWSAGCSSGEEPYTIAITVREVLGTGSSDLRILATDIDTEMLAQAQAARYSLESLTDIPPERKRKSFLRGYGDFEGLAEVRPEIRRLVEFRRLNFRDANWGIQERFDAIFCRNVIIYFDRSQQQRIVERLVSYLKPDGCYFSGHSENLYWLDQLLVSIEPTIYQLKKGERW